MSSSSFSRSVRGNVVVWVVLAGLVVTGVAYRDALGAWLAPLTGNRGANPTSAVPTRPTPPAYLTKALQAYERARALLAADTLEGMSAQAEALAAALEAEARVHEHASSEPPVSDAARAARALGQAADLETARIAFGDLSQHMITLVRANPALASGLHQFECPMAEGYKRWLQPSAELANPYMGQKMLACGSAVPLTPAPAHAPHEHAGDPSDIAYYTCPMHPSVKQAGPGACPICAMDLTPVTQGELASGLIVVDEAQRQRIGVRIETIAQRAMTLKVRAVGAVRFDESRLHDVSLRMGGWVQRLLVDETGQRVRAGQTLFTLYSPELYAAQLEHLAGMQRKAGAGALLGDTSRASRQRLRLLGMSEDQVAALEQRGEAEENLAIAAPASGFVIEKDVIEGARVDAGMRVYRIADLSKVWIDAEIYESDVPHVRVGQTATVELPHVPGASYAGTVDYVYPTLDPKSRTARARVVLDNPKLELKPAMYANVVIEVALGEKLAVPASAVIYTGPRRLVFVDVGADKLRPKEVTLGAQVDGFYEVKQGLEAGDKVVTSGNFLIAAESRIRSAASFWETPHDAP